MNERRHVAEARLDGSSKYPSAQLGARLRALREAQRLTLAQVASSARLTKGFLSKVEREVATPSVASLIRITEALGVSLGSLLSGGVGEEHQPVRAGSYPQIGFGGQGIAESLLTPPRERRLQVIHSVIEPGGGSGEEAYTLPVAVEFVLILRGTLDLRVDDRIHRLATGDALTFPPGSPHTFENPDAADAAEVLWVLAPALPSDEPLPGVPLHGPGAAG